jgi:hypothetical protein
MLVLSICVRAMAVGDTPLSETVTAAGRPPLPHVELTVLDVS